MNAGLNTGTVLIGILGLAVLMVIHESGHYFAARYFGLRVTKFSIGFGPTLWKHQPAGSPTVYQVAVIPFLAYVQIAGMNPYEENDPEDKGSYANASVTARIVTIVSGPLSNYLAASLLFFAGLMIAGNVVEEKTTMRVSVAASGPAAAADMREGDRILNVNGEAVHDWDQLRKLVSSHPGEKIDVEVERAAGERAHLGVTPGPKGDKNEGKIQIAYFRREHVPVTIPEAARLSVEKPAEVVYETVRGMLRSITGKDKLQVIGPYVLVQEVAIVAGLGPGPLFSLLGALSAYLALFNLLPIPALDGGRLAFLGFEAAARKKPDAMVEARIHAVGLLMMLALIAVLTIGEVMPKH